MIKLTKETAEFHYEKMVAIHYFQWLTLAQKVSIFFQDLEHEILRKITEKNDFFEQWNYLRDYQSKNKNINIDPIPPTLVSDLHSYKPWRNEAVHRASPSIDKITYLKLFQTMVQVIKHFSGIQWTVEINRIINDQTNVSINKKNKDIKTEDEKIKLGKNEAIKIINEKLSLNINDKKSAYSSINELVPQWTFNISNEKFDNDYYIILEDQNEKVIYYFYLKRGALKNYNELFNQRNDKRVSNKSIIIIPVNKKFINTWNGKEFNFNQYKLLEINYQ